LSIAASPSRTWRMISTVRWQYGQRATLAPDSSGTTLKVPLHRLRSVDGRTATLLYRRRPTHARASPSMLPRRTPAAGHGRGHRTRSGRPQCLASDGKTGQPRGNGRSWSRSAEGTSPVASPGPESRQNPESEQATSRSMAKFRLAVTGRAKCGQWTTTASSTDRRTNRDYTRSVRPRRVAAPPARPAPNASGRRPASRRTERRSG
jgi:hypothetical protein